MNQNNKKYQKWSPEWAKETKRLSLILDGTETQSVVGDQTDDSKKKSQQLAKLLTERTNLETEKQEKASSIRKLETEKKQLTNIASYLRAVGNEETRLNTNSTTHTPRMNNFLGNGTGTKWGTNGWIKNATDHFTPASGALNNLYKVKINGAEVEVTEEQVLNTTARIVLALKKVDFIRLYRQI